MAFTLSMHASRWISTRAAKQSRIPAVSVRAQHLAAAPAKPEQPQRAVRCLVAPLAPQRVAPQQQEEGGWIGSLLSIFQAPREEGEEEWRTQFGHLLDEAEERGSRGDVYTSHLFERAAMAPRK